MPRSPSRIDRARLSPQWPRPVSPSAFWEQLGRTIATFGLRKTCLARRSSPHGDKRVQREGRAEYLAKWDKQLHQALTDTLWPLSEVWQGGSRAPGIRLKNVDELVDDIKKASKIRNALCHGSWHALDASGTTDLYYFDKKDGKFDSRIDIGLAATGAAHVVGPICSVIDSVTVRGGSSQAAQARTER